MMCFIMSSSRVYPRVCGGTARRRAANRWAKGLSPRVRGNPQRISTQNSRVGSIPACAGEPAPPELIAGGQRVYPRVCGGTGIISYCMTWNRGLSPRVRGNPRIFSAALRFWRSIPACAGEPRPTWWAARPIKVYPRVCGGTDAKMRRESAFKGLSPRVRGNRPAHRLWRAPQRSIPACAGEPQNSPFRGGRSAVYPRVCGGTPWTFDSTAAIIFAKGMTQRRRQHSTRRITPLSRAPLCPLPYGAAPP